MLWLHGSYVDKIGNTLDIFAPDGPITIALPTIHRSRPLTMVETMDERKHCFLFLKYSVFGNEKYHLATEYGYFRAGMYVRPRHTGRTDVGERAKERLRYRALRHSRVVSNPMFHRKGLAVRQAKLRETRKTTWAIRSPIPSWIMLSRYVNVSREWSDGQGVVMNNHAWKYKMAWE